MTTSTQWYAAAAVLREHAEKMDQLGREVEATEDGPDLEAERKKIKCPVCGGTKIVRNTTTYDVVVHDPCPENGGQCDGFVSWQRLFAVVGAVAGLDDGEKTMEPAFRDYLLTSPLVEGSVRSKVQERYGAD